MLEIQNLNIIKKENNRVLLENFNFILHEKDKVAIIGEEGNGKSTLIKAIYNLNLIKDYCYVKGNIINPGYKIGYLEQILDEKWNAFSVFDYFLKSDVNSEIDYARYSETQNILSYFSKFNLDKNIIDENRIISTLSGGEKVKIQLIKILLDDPDILLLDEPSNDLDIETLLWLEKFIKESNKAIMFISHDETLLENTATVIIHLEQIMKKTKAKYTICKTNYSDYIENRLHLIDKQNQISINEKKEFDEKLKRWQKIYNRVDHEQRVISRQDPHGGFLLKKKMHCVKAIGRRLEKEKSNLTKKIDTEDSINISFDYSNDLNKNKIIYNEIIKPLKIDNKVLSEEVKLTIKAKDHLVIIGKNGVGKSTLLKIIYNSLKDKYKVGYMPQNYDDKLDLNSKVLDFICLNKDKEEITKAMTFLGSLKFSEEEMNGKISELSGGQKAKLLLIKLILDKSEVLVLDEPTRNLSPLSNPVIRKVLKEFDGCIISISHDRKYIDEVCDDVYELDKFGLKNLFK